jgi:hypothetical protein
MCLHTKKTAKIIEEENQDKPFEGQNSPNLLAVMAQAKAEHKKANGITTTGVLTSKKK